MPQIPENLKSFIETAYNPQLVELIEQGSADTTADQFVNDVQFIDDMIRRIAFGLGKKGYLKFTDEIRPTSVQLTDLANWMKEIAPEGLALYKAHLLDFEYCSPSEARIKQRTTELIREYYPEGYAAIFGEESEG